MRKLLDWKEYLLPDEEEVGSWLSEEMRFFLGNVLWDRNPERIAKAAFEANWRAKEEDYDWYIVKSILLHTFIQISPEYLIWGLGLDEQGGDVLYIDLPGSGQLSFHIFEFYDELYDVESIPDYPFPWTEVVNDKSLLENPRIIEVTSSDKELILDGCSPGEKHNLLMRYGKDPSLAWEDRV